MNSKLVLFDLDGTLLDTLEDLYLATNYSLKKHNLPLHTKEEVRLFVGCGIKVLIQRAITPHLDQFEEVFSDFKQYYNKHASDHTKVYDGIFELLQTLKDKNIILGVVSNKRHDYVQALVDKYFPNTFDFVIGQNDFLKPKPSKDMIDYAIRTLSVNKDEVIYIGDSEVDIQTSINAQVKGVFVSYGFRTVQELQQFKDVIIVDHPMMILKYLRP